MIVAFVVVLAILVWWQRAHRAWNKFKLAEGEAMVHEERQVSVDYERVGGQQTAKLDLFFTNKRIFFTAKGMIWWVLDFSGEELTGGKMSVGYFKTRKEKVIWHGGESVLELHTGSFWIKVHVQNGEGVKRALGLI